MEMLVARAAGLIEEVCHEIEQPGQIHHAIDQLFCGLREIKRSSSEESWEGLIARFRRSPLKGLLHQDPITARAFYKPRGYAGDAVMMDYIYDSGRPGHGMEGISQ